MADNELSIFLTLVVIVAVIFCVYFFISAESGEFPHDAGKITINVASTDKENFMVLSSDMNSYLWVFPANETTMIRINFEFDKIEVGKNYSCEEITYNGWLLDPKPYPHIKNCNEVI